MAGRAQSMVRVSVRGSELVSFLLLSWTQFLILKLYRRPYDKHHFSSLVSVVMFDDLSVLIITRLPNGSLEHNLIAA